VVFYLVKTYKTTKQNFEYFKQRFKYWQVKLGLINYIVYFDHVEKDNVFAWIHWDLRGMIATVGLNTNFSDEPPTKTMLDRCAFHEACELMLVKVTEKLQDTYSDDVVGTLIHEVIRRLEHVCLDNKDK